MYDGVIRAYKHGSFVALITISCCHLLTGQVYRAGPRGKNADLEVGTGICKAGTRRTS